MQRLLIVFAKTPIAGQVKTRMGSVVGLDRAAGIYEEMLEIVLAESRSNDNWKQIVAITPESAADYFLLRGFDVLRQRGGDIGQRMSDSLTQGFRQGASQVVIIGSDIPTLRRSEIRDAFAMLNSAPAVIGPSHDGGFYLIGANEAGYNIVAHVLQGNIKWSTPEVLAKVSELCVSNSLPWVQLPPKKDVDTYEDWLDYKTVQAAGRFGLDSPREGDCLVSVVIPTLNEEKYLADCLKSVAHPRGEVIVVDAGSVDRTVAIAESFGAKVIRMDVANRAKQMNAGAVAAQGGLLLFFHADSRLPAEGVESILQTMIDPKVVGGAFSLGFFPQETFYSALAIGANLFCRITRMIFGDRGMFLRADHFQELGRFPELAIMEDAALATEMRRSGKIVILPGVVMTSARKYANETKLQAVYRTMWAYAAYRLGVPAEKIKAGYYDLK